MADERQFLLEFTVIVLMILGLLGGAYVFIQRRIEKVSERTRGQVKDLYAKIEKLGDDLTSKTDELRKSTMRREDIESRLRPVERYMSGLAAKCTPDKPS